MGGLRFRIGEGPFLDDDDARAAPPLTSLRALEQASLELERTGDGDILRAEAALQLLLVPGSSLGGARPKASVTDVDGSLWLAKFPSDGDTHDVGAWEAVAATLARDAGVSMAPSRAERFSHRHHTFLTRRFDRNLDLRLHFTSAMTMTGHRDGEAGSYLELADVLIQQGAAPNEDLEQLWRRIVFSMCISHVDDHLRNHGFLWGQGGWRLAPAYDVNPIPSGRGHVLNIDLTSNAQDLALARDVAPWFRVDGRRSETIIAEVSAAVRRWPEVASQQGLSRDEQQRMAPAFRLVDRPASPGA
jgi:serine/threonine-protein kinase HipA